MKRLSLPLVRRRDDFVHLGSNISSVFQHTHDVECDGPLESVEMGKTYLQKSSQREQARYVGSPAQPSPKAIMLWMQFRD